MSEIAPSSMCAGGPDAIPQTCVRAVTARPAVPTGSAATAGGYPGAAGRRCTAVLRGFRGEPRMHPVRVP
jgi:hypothetical protein